MSTFIRGLMLVKVLFLIFKMFSFFHGLSNILQQMNDASSLFG